MDENYENSESGSDLRRAVNTARTGKNAVKFMKKAGKLGKKVKALGAKKVASAITSALLANPPVLIIIGVAIGVLLITVFFVCILYYLTTGGVLMSVKGFFASLSAIVASFFSSVNNTWKDLIGSDGHLGLQATKEYTANTDSYDEDNEFDLGYIKMYEMEHQLLNNAYNHAVDIDIKQKAKNEGWSYNDICNKLNQKYPNGYEDVYKDINWGEFMAVLDAGFNAGFYTDDETVTAKSDNAVEYIKDKYLSDALNGKSSKYMQYFYYLSYDVGTDENGNTVVDATIHMFTWTQLYTMFGVAPTDLVKEDETTCYVDLQEQSLAQARAECSDEYDEKRTIYETLQLDSNAVEWTYGFSNESVADFISADLDEDDNDCPIEVVTPFDTSQWYTSVPEVSDAKVLVKTYQGWMDMYSAPTCIVGASSYFVNTELASQDIVNDINNNGVSVSYSTSGWCGYEWGNWQGSFQGVSWEYGKGGSAVKNGRYLVAVAPGIVHRDYWQTTGGVAMNSAWYNYGSKLMDLVLQDNDTGEIYYVPITTGDAKGHAFPYGIMQTGIATPKSMSAQIQGATFMKVAGSDSYYKNLGTAQDYPSVIRNFDNIVKGEGYSGIGQWLSHGMVEWCYKSKTMNLSALRKQYKLKGIIVYN